MAIPSVDKNYIYKALEYIDVNGVPKVNQSVKYELVTKDGKCYPPKYVIAVANHLENGADISAEGFNAIEAKNYLENLDFSIVIKDQEKYELFITANSIKSTDERFTIDNLGIGDNYTPLDACFKSENGTEIKRRRNKGEQRISNQTLPRIAFQIFEKQISNLSSDEKKNFPVCKYRPDSEMIIGIFSTVDEFKSYRNTIECLIYKKGNGEKFVIYSWNIFSTIVFVQECLKRFGKPNDQFILTYREKDKNETDVSSNKSDTQGKFINQCNGYRNPLSSTLIKSKNLILRGAPGTGKSYLAKEIAADIVSNGYYDKYELLSDEQKAQVEFVQFHPSYDYSDFVEGLRPTMNNDGTMGFGLQDGIFKKFITRARQNYENSQKEDAVIERELSVQESITNFLSNIEFGTDTFETVNGSKFTIIDVDDEHITISIPENAAVNKLNLNIDEIRKMLESGKDFSKVKDITAFFGKTFSAQSYSYEFIIYRAIRETVKGASKGIVKKEELKKYIFIIDEINRGEISKIFGELFFAIDPGYRGKIGEIATKYSNLHSDPKEKFYIPDNVYIIGTMNDIDRSVDSFDFAMRRRFRFVELRSNECLEMLESLENEELETEAIRRMEALNQEIINIEDLNENYQIGASYFLKLKSVNFDQLWTDYLQPLLREYVQGMYDEDGIMNRFAKAYGIQKPIEGNINESTQN